MGENDGLIYTRTLTPEMINQAERYRFQTKYVKRSGTKCWDWIGGKSSGYGRFLIYRGKHEFFGAHRVSWVLRRGPIPYGMVLDHLCRNTLCVNPDHLEVVTNAENIRRGRQSSLSSGHCKRGHDLGLPDALHYRPNGKRQCKRCMQETNRASARRHAERQKRLKEAA